MMPEKAMPSHCVRSHVGSHSPPRACFASQIFDPRQIVVLKPVAPSQFLLTVLPIPPDLGLPKTQSKTASPILYT